MQATMCWKTRRSHRSSGSFVSRRSFCGDVSMSAVAKWRASDLASFLRAAAVDRPAQPAYIFGDQAIRFEELDRLSDICARGVGKSGYRAKVTVSRCLSGQVRSSSCSPSGSFAAEPFRFSSTPVSAACISRDASLRRLPAPSSVSRWRMLRAVLLWLGKRLRSHARDRGRPVVLGRRSLHDVMKAGANAQTGPSPPPDPDALAAIAFTSGSTGPPKGAMYSASKPRRPGAPVAGPFRDSSWRARSGNLPALCILRPGLAGDRSDPADGLYPAGFGISSRIIEPILAAEGYSCLWITCAPRSE